MPLFCCLSFLKERQSNENKTIVYPGRRMNCRINAYSANKNPKITICNTPGNFIRINFPYEVVCGYIQQGVAAKRRTWKT